MGAQRSQNAAGGGDPDHFVRPGRQHRRVGEPLQPDYEDGASGGGGGGGNLARQAAAPGQNPQGPWLPGIGRNRKIH